MTEDDIVLVKQKHEQLNTLLSNMEADCWVTFCREGNDPSTLLFTGYPMVGESGFVFLPSGESYAIVANYDQMAIDELGVFDEVVGYDMEGIDEHLRSLIKDISPEKIALNYSKEEFLTDGLSHGMFKRLEDILEVDDLADNSVSSRPVLERLRAKKTPIELKRIGKAVEVTGKIFEEVTEFAEAGMTEREVCDFIEKRQSYYETPAVGDYGAAVCTGKVGIGHRSPGNYPLDPGDVVSIDMGVYYKGYCSDYTRTYYVLREGETKPPAEFRERFQITYNATHKAIEAMEPGKMGHEIDEIARNHMKDNGIEPYNNALGHQIGRRVHDGGGLLSPLVKRYGEKGKIPLEEGNVYTVEPFIYSKTEKDGAPPIGLEEDVVVTEDGVEILSEPQQELICIKSA